MENFYALQLLYLPVKLSVSDTSPRISLFPSSSPLRALSTVEDKYIYKNMDLHPNFFLSFYCLKQTFLKLNIHKKTIYKIKRYT